MDVFLEGAGLKFENLQQGLPCYMKVRHPDADRLGFDVCLAQMGLELYTDSMGEKKMRAKGVRDKDDNMVTPDKNFSTFMALEFFGNVSLNRVAVTVDGVMTVDVNSIAGRIDEVNIDLGDCSDAGKECLWTNVDADGGLRTGVIRGAYLKDAQLKLAEAEELSITDLKTIEEESTDDELHFSFKLNAPIPNQTKLHFTVTKPAATEGGKALESNTWEYVVAYFPSATAITSVILDNAAAPTKLTVKGKGFKATPLVVSLLPKTGDSVTVAPKDVTVKDDATFEVVLPTDAKKLHAGCWRVQVTAAGIASNKSEWFAVPPDPFLDSAERTDKFIFVKGRDLMDFGACGGQQVSFKLLGKNASDTTDLEVKDWNNGAPLLKLPDKAKEGEWKVQVSNKKGDKKNDKPLTVRQ